MDVFGGEAKAVDALSSLLYSSASSFVLFKGARRVVPLPLLLAVPTRNKLKPFSWAFWPFAEGRAVSFGRKTARCCHSEYVGVSGIVGPEELGWTGGCVGRRQGIFCSRCPFLHTEPLLPSSLLRCMPSLFSSKKRLECRPPAYRPVPWHKY